MVRKRTYGSALNEIAAQRERAVRAERENTALLRVLNEALDAVRALNAVLPNGDEAVAR